MAKVYHTCVWPQIKIIWYSNLQISIFFHFSEEKKGFIELVHQFLFEDVPNTIQNYQGKASLGGKAKDRGSSTSPPKSLVPVQPWDAILYNIGNKLTNKNKYTNTCDHAYDILLLVFIDWVFVQLIYTKYYPPVQLLVASGKYFSWNWVFCSLTRSVLHCSFYKTPWWNISFILLCNMAVNWCWSLPSFQHVCVFASSGQAGSTVLIRKVQPKTSPPTVFIF